MNDAEKKEFIKAVIAELRDATDHIPDSRISIGGGKFVSLYTRGDVHEWLEMMRRSLQGTVDDGVPLEDWS